MIDNQPYNWLVKTMDDIGIFEAKTKFPSICDQVVRNGAPILVRRRGKPLVLISPAGSVNAGQKKGGILDEVSAWQARHTETADSDFPETWRMRRNRDSHPLSE